MKKFFFRLTLILLTIMLAACSSNSATSDSSEEKGSTGKSGKTITINAVSFIPKDDPLTAPVHEYVKMVEEATGGQVKINWRGGADVIPVPEQANAVQTGVMDMVIGYTGQYETQNRAVQAMPLSKLQPWEERESGFFDAMAEAHSKIDMVYLGRWLNTSPSIWLNKPIESLDELDGKKLRATVNFSRFMESLGVKSTVIDPSEVYTSLQTGIVEGFVWGGLSGPRKNGWTDSTKYVLDHPFWTSNCTIVVNPDKWAEISEENQQKILDTTAEFERYMVDYNNKEAEKEKVELEKAGVKFIKLPEDEAKTFTEKAYEVEWEYLKKEIPNEVENLKKLSE